MSYYVIIRTRLIFATMHSIHTIGHDHFYLLNWVYFFLSILDILWFYSNVERAQAAMQGLFGNYIRSLDGCSSFGLLLALQNRSLTPSLSSIILYSLLFSRWSPLLLDQHHLSWQPLIFQSSSVGVLLTARLTGKYHIPFLLCL